MTFERYAFVLRSISHAVDEEDMAHNPAISIHRIRRNAVQYGASRRVTFEEVEGVLSLPMRDTLVRYAKTAP